MIGKVIAYGDTRDTAIARMRNALAEMVVEASRPTSRCIKRYSIIPLSVRVAPTSTIWSDAWA